MLAGVQMRPKLCKVANIPAVNNSINNYLVTDFPHFSAIYRRICDKAVVSGGANWNTW